MTGSGLLYFFAIEFAKKKKKKKTTWKLQNSKQFSLAMDSHNAQTDRYSYIRMYQKYKSRSECLVPWDRRMRGAINNLEIATITWFRVMDLACVTTRHMLYSLPIELHFNFSLINLICDWGCASSQILRMSINSLDGCLVCHMCCYRLLGCHADQSIKRERSRPAATRCCSGSARLPGTSLCSFFFGGEISPKPADISH